MVESGFVMARSLRSRVGRRLMGSGAFMGREFSGFVGVSRFWFDMMRWAG